MADIDPELAGLDLEALDPTPDVHALFSYYNSLYFDNQLGACSVEWSTKRMTLCAGVCHFSRWGGCRIKLSGPLLKFRPVKDLKETLLHEMIHAALFLGNLRDDGDHGPKFRALMNRINNATCADPQRPPGGYNITVYHTMHDEVNNYRTHVWSCTHCGNVVRRSMNRPPQEADCRSYSKAAAATAAAGGVYCGDARCWYHGHMRTCGGAYEKIAEPDKPQPPSKPASASSSGNGSKHPNAANKRRAAAAAVGPAITAFFPKQQERQRPSQQPTRQEDQQQQQEQQRAQASQLEQQRSQASQLEQQRSQMQALVDVPVQADTRQQQQQPQSSSSCSKNPSSKPPDARTAAAAAAAALARATPGMAAASTGSFVVVTQQSLQQRRQQLQNMTQQQQQQHEAGAPLSQPVDKQQQQQRAGIHSLQPMDEQQQRQPLLPRFSTQQQQWPSCIPLLRPDMQQQQQPVDVVELLSSDDEDPDFPTAAAGKQHGRSPGRPPASQMAGASDGVEATGGMEGDSLDCNTFMCPVCCLDFSQLTALNVHLDACLL